MDGFPAIMMCMGKSGHIVSIALLFAVAVPFVAQAATYYVSMAGDDSNSGLTTNLAFATIQEGINNTAPGDTIEVLAGTYAGFRIQTAGTSNAWITVCAAAGADVLLNSLGVDAPRNCIIEIASHDSAVEIAYWRIEGFEIALSPRYGIGMFGYSGNHQHHIDILNCRVHDSHVSGIFTAFVSDVRIEGNECWSNNEHGVYHSNSGDRSIVRMNHLYNNSACGFQCNADAYSGGDGIVEDLIIEHNLIHGNGQGGGAGINLSGVDGGRIYNNLIYDEIAGGISMNKGYGAIGCRNLDVCHNTVDLGVTVYSGRWAINMPDADCYSNRVYNNVLHTENYLKGSILVSSPIPAGFESDYNVVEDMFTVDGGASSIGLSTWQAYGLDTHSLIAAPADVCVDPASGDYHLSSNSVAIDAGVDLSQINIDLEFAIRPQGLSHDIGCYEYPSDLLRLTSRAHEGGTITPEGAQVLEPGTNQSYTIASSVGYRILSVVTDEGAATETNHGAITEYEFTNVQSNHTIDAYFTEVHTVTPVAGVGGSITPSNALTVDLGESVSFDVSADEHWHITGIRMNGIELGSFQETNRLTFARVGWSNVTATTTIEATFAENVWEMSVPQEWLAGHYPTSNDYEGVALTDTDADSFLAWEEYMAGTDPDDPDSRFRIIESGRLGDSNYVRWLGSSAGSPVPFSIYSAPGLGAGSTAWGYVTNCPKTSNMTNTWYGPGAGVTSSFYRVTVGP